MANAELTLLVDSVIVIDHFNGIAPATDYLRRQQAGIALSVITRTEVLTGFDEPDARATARALLDRFPTLPIHREIGDSAALLRQQYRWKLPDALQAAVALHHGLRLVTRDTGDFPPDRHAFVEVPYALGE